MFDLAPEGRVAGSRWRRRGRDLLTAEGGAAGIEFALIAPLLIALLIGILDLGMAVQARREAHAAAQAGAQFSLIAGWEPAEIESAVANSSTLSAPLITVERVWACSAAGGLSFVSAGSSCGGGGAGTYVRITVDPQFDPLLPLRALAVAPATTIVRIE